MDDLAQDPINAKHVPVLLDEVLNGLRLTTGATIIDATLGGGGHTSAILKQIGEQGRVLAIDADPAALRRVSERLAEPIEAKRLILYHGAFEHLADAAAQHGIKQVDGILFDFGLSSFQLETAARGFSFQQSGPLDMRFNPEQSLDASEIVNQWPEDDLADTIYVYGEERRSRHIARQIVENRPIETTDALAAIVERAAGGKSGGKSKSHSKGQKGSKKGGKNKKAQQRSRIHPATRTFQALRIAVNRELSQIESVLPSCLPLLKPGGRLAVISFHSLEDRIVKQWMREESATYVKDPTTVLGGYDRQPGIKLVTRKPITPTDDEIAHNPRSRSAKLRIAEKVGT